MKLIDKSALVAEITKRVKEGEIVGRDIPSSAIFGLTQAYKNVLSFIDTLEVKEVDLNKEIMKYQREIYDRDTTVRDVAKHFFELGLKAQKGE